MHWECQLVPAHVYMQEHSTKSSVLQRKQDLNGQDHLAGESDNSRDSENVHVWWTSLSSLPRKAHVTYYSVLSSSYTLHLTWTQKKFTLLKFILLRKCQKFQKSQSFIPTRILALRYLYYEVLTRYLVAEQQIDVSDKGSFMGTCTHYI